MTEKIDKFLIVSIDCWRRDALSRTNPRMNTPKFDLLTRDYAFAERYFVTAPATRPSHTSLFTGLYPFEHGLFGQTYLKMFADVANLFDILPRPGTVSGGFPSGRTYSASSTSRLLSGQSIHQPPSSTWDRSNACAPS